MKEQAPKLILVFLAVIALTLLYIAYKISQPNYITTDSGQYLDTRSGTFYQKRGNQLVPVEESFEERLKREFPGGREN